MSYRVAAEIGGREFSIEMGRVARQADGAAYVCYGDTVVLATACAAKEPREGMNFLPLTVDYRENTYAAGKIPGGFFKREGRPTEKEILTSRLIDRPLRPLFPEGYNYETQVIALVLSADKENDPDIMSISGASAALYCSPIPFFKPIAGVRVGLMNGAFVVNPTTSSLKDSRLNLTIAGNEEAIVMVEAGADEVSEEQMVEALDFGHGVIRQLIALQKDLYRQINPVKRQVVKPSFDAAEYERMERSYAARISEALRIKGKLASYARLDELKKEVVEAIPAEDAQRQAQATAIFDRVLERVFRKEILEDRVRPDTRRFNEIRPITAQVSVLPRTHGSALFTRGETQALVTVTLGTADDEQRMDTLEGESFKRFMLHYNFPPFSVGEVKFLRGPGRREIGHGALSERSLLPVMPSEEAFPYTIRVVSDILESNGSSSMATICGGILALMDAGVPIKSPVAGVAMGLVKEGEKYAILSDIAGVEDHYASDGHKDRRDHARADGRGLESGAGGPALRTSEDGGISGRSSSRDIRLCPEDHNDPDSQGQDWRCHRYGRQNNPGHHRADGRQDRYRGRWKSQHRLHRHGIRPEGDSDDRGSGHGGRGGQNLPGHRDPAGGLRRLCRNLSRYGGAPPHLGSRGLPCPGHQQRAQIRR